MKRFSSAKPIEKLKSFIKPENKHKAGSVKGMSPSTAELEAELYREKYKNRYLKVLKGTLSALVIVAAVSILVATILLPVFEIYGTSMNPNLVENDIVFSVKTNIFERGDIIAFYYNNRILVKRIVAMPGENVSIDKKGNVFVDGQQLDEPYLSIRDYGETDLEFPYRVPENSFFVLGDNRTNSVDSRNSAIGCIDSQEIVGKILFTVWPVKRFGKVK